VANLVTLEGQVRTIPIAPSGISQTVTFDGARYRFFWIADGFVRHRALDEDGTLSGESMIEPVPVVTSYEVVCVTALSDRVGTTVIVVTPQVAAAYATEVPSDGSLPLRIWTSPADWRGEITGSGVWTSVWHKHELYVRVHDVYTAEKHLVAIDPAGGSRVLPREQEFFNAVSAGGSIYFFDGTPPQVVEVDGDFRRIASTPPPQSWAGSGRLALRSFAGGAAVANYVEDGLVVSSLGSGGNELFSADVVKDTGGHSVTICPGDGE
jgi:hypothetical protein